MGQRPTPHRTRLLDELGWEARRTGSVSTLHNRAAAHLVGIGDTDWECLDLLDWTGPLPAGELARRLGITSGAVTGLLDRLERAGLAKRMPDPKDRRRVMAALCRDEELPDQMAVLGEGFAAMSAELDDINASFDDDQLDAILTWLRATNTAVERSIERFRAATEEP